MLRPFQVNVGKFLNLDRDILPTAKVSELCSVVEAVSGEDASSQVLLASDGRQMNPSEHIGAYAITESQPVYVFYRSHLMSPDPPIAPTILPHRGELQQHLELLKLKPSPALFKRQVALAKRLSEYSALVGRVCSQLAEEYQLQVSGWRTVLSNCTSIIKMYQKHKTLFTKSVEGFNQAKPQFWTLLQEFPSHLKLLQQLPVPSALSKEATPTSLYDWISTHDEKNSLQDLGAECQRSLSKVDSDRIDSTLKSSELILSGADSLLVQEDELTEKIAHLRSLAEDATVKVDTQMRLSQNILSTSERALRSGDAGTIADLVLSHHKSLELMASYCQQLEASGRDMERSKIALTRHIHTKLKEVTQLQKRVADSNNQLLMFHEHVKLAKKRFEILEQVCTAPDILGNVLSEVERRRYYNSSLEKKTGEVSQLLRRAREEEKLLRRSFAGSYGQHFILTLFPELQDRVPNITVHLPESLLKSSLSADKDLENIRHLLPENARSSTMDLNCTSIKLLSTPLVMSDMELNATELSLQIDSTDSPLSINKVTTAETDTQTDEQLGGDDKQKLREQLESITHNIHLNREQYTTEKEQFETSLYEERIKSTQLSVQVEQLQNDKEQLQLVIDQLQKEREQFIDSESTKCTQLQLQMEELNKEKEELLKRLNTQQIKTTQLFTQVEQLNEEAESLRSLIKEHQVFMADKENNLLQVETENRRLQSSNEELKVTSDDLSHQLDECKLEISTQKTIVGQQEVTIEQYQREKEELKKCVDEGIATKNNLLTQLNNVQVDQSTATEKFELEQTRAKERVEMLNEQLEKLRGELEESKAEKDMLIVQANQVQDLANVSKRLNEKELELNHATEQYEDKTKMLQQKYDKLESELLQLKETSAAEKQLQESRYQQAQVAINSLKSQLDKAQQQVRNAESKEKESKEKLTVIEGKIASTNNVALQLQTSERHKKEALKIMENKLSECERERKEFKKRAEEAKKKIIVCENDLKQSRNERDKVLSESKEKQAKCCEEIEVLKAKCIDISTQRDSHMKHAMEVERELKEHKRDMGLSPPASLNPSESPSVPFKPFPPPASSSKVVMTVSIGTLQVGDTALFVNDPFGNYLALTLDDKTYYLNQSSVGELDDLALKNPRLNLPRKILCGKLTNRVLVEVRKESNRLHVPVGERLYKVDAESHKLNELL